jgi:hypothetical protein
MTTEPHTPFNPPVLAPEFGAPTVAPFGGTDQAPERNTAADVDAVAADDVIEDHAEPVYAEVRALDGSVVRVAIVTD